MVIGVNPLESVPLRTDMTPALGWVRGEAGAGGCLLLERSHDIVENQQDVSVSLAGNVRPHHRTL